MTIMARVLRGVRETRDGINGSDWLKWQDVTSPGGTYSGVHVTQSTAMTCSAVYAAVSFISETIATLPVDVMQRYGDGSRYPRPAPQWMIEPVVGELGWTEFVQQVMTSLLLDGNAFIGVKRKGLEPQALWPLDPKAVTVQRNLETKQVEYIINTTTTPRIFTGKDILHIRGLTMPGAVRGLSPVDQAAESIGRTIAAGQFAGSFFRNGATPGTVISTVKSVDDETAKRVAEKFDKAHAGTGNAFRTVVIGGDPKITSVSLSPEQVQMLETMKFGISDVARWYRIAPHIIGDVERSTSWGTGIAEQNQMTANFTLSPWTVRLQRALQPLIADTFVEPNYYLAFNLKGLMRGDPQAQAVYMKAKIECQSATPNEWRAMDDENPLPEGGKVLQSVQFTPKTAAPPTPPATGGGTNA